MPRAFLVPGRRLKLHPDDIYAFGGQRGGIDERWFSSTIKASNGPLTRDDEGLSYVRLDNGKNFLLKDAVEVAGDSLLGSDVMAREGGWNILCRFFDNLGPIPHHMHQSEEFAKKVGQRGKPEAYYFPPQYNVVQNNFVAMTETFIKERKHNLTGRLEPVGIDDASAFLCRFENGSLATFEATRYARGHKALYTLEINGEHASAIWDLHDLHRIQFFDHRDEGQLRGWRSLHITDREHPYMKHWWVPGLQIGYEYTFTHQFADFLQAVQEGKQAAPTFREALATDQVTDAVLKSAKTRQWEGVPRSKANRVA